MFKREKSTSNGTKNSRRRGGFLRAFRLRSRRPTSTYTPQKSLEDHSTVACTNEPSLDLPTAIWVSNVFPFLNRKSQNSLAQAHPDIARARRVGDSCRTIMSWPNGRITKIKRPVKSLEFSPDNSTLFFTKCNKKVLLYDKLQGPARNQAALSGHPGTVAVVAFSPNGQTLATGSRNDGTIRLWVLQPDNTNKYQCFRILHAYQDDLRHMVWSPCNKYIATWGVDGLVRVLNVVDGSLKSVHWKTKLEVMGCQRVVAFAPPLSTNTNSPVVAFAHNNEKVLLWHCDGDRLEVLPGSNEIAHSYDGNYITGLAYSPKINGKMYLVVGCHIATLKFWRLTKRQPQEDGDRQLEEPRNNALEDRREYDYNFEKQIFLGGGWSAVTLLTFTEDGRFMACSNHGTQIRIIDLGKARVVTTLQGHKARIEALCFTSDAKTLASAGCDRTIRLWDMSDYIIPNEV